MLLRWQHAIDSAVQPSQLVAVAEDSTLMLPLCRWLLAEACRQRQQWLPGSPQPVLLSISISPLQLVRPEIVEAVTEALARSGLAPDQLELALCPGEAPPEVTALRPTMNRLRQLGVHFALDGLSSGMLPLHYLQELPLESIQLDATLLQKLQEPGASAALLEGMIVLGHRLGLRVIARGVETTEQLSALRQHECDAAQGMLLGRPMPLRLLEVSPMAAGLGLPTVARLFGALPALKKTARA